MKRMFLFVDVQKDFMNPYGALYVPNATKIIPTLEKIAKLAFDEFDKDPENVEIAFTQDFHLKTDAEFISNSGQFPEHCIKGTDGAILIINPKFNGTIYTKRCTNIFDSKLGNKEFKKLIKENFFKEIWVSGVVTEICVNHAVMGIKKISPATEIYVFENAIMHLDEKTKEKTFKTWKSNGIHIAHCGL